MTRPSSTQRAKCLGRCRARQPSALYLSRLGAGTMSFWGWAAACRTREEKASGRWLATACDHWGGTSTAAAAGGRPQSVTIGGGGDSSSGSSRSGGGSTLGSGPGVPIAAVLQGTAVPRQSQGPCPTTDDRLRCPARAHAMLLTTSCSAHSPRPLAHYKAHRAKATLGLSEGPPPHHLSPQPATTQAPHAETG